MCLRKSLGNPASIKNWTTHTHAFWPLVLNRPVPSPQNPHSQNEARCKNLSCENEFYLHENEKWFPYQRQNSYHTPHLACSRLSDSWEDAKVKSTRKVGGVGKRKKPPLLSPVSSRVIFVFALSQFSGLDYLGAWNRLLLAIIPCLFASCLIFWSITIVIVISEFLSPNYRMI